MIRTKTPVLALVWALTALFFGLPALAEGCKKIRFEQVPYTICEAGIGEDLRLFHAGATGRPLGSFEAVEKALAGEGGRLGFAMNAGMYHSDRGPVGLLVVDGVETHPIVTADGPGNFGLLPNGVFCIGAENLSVMESRAFAESRPACRYATQSGPMLVIDGILHPRFLKDSDSLNIRNGVGVSADGTRAVFAISDAPVNFYNFARLFRDHLGLANALYLDGSISRLYAANLGRHDGGFPMGPIVGTVVPKD